MHVFPVPESVRILFPQISQSSLWICGSLRNDALGSESRLFYSEPIGIVLVILQIDTVITDIFPQHLIVNFPNFVDAYFTD